MLSLLLIVVLFLNAALCALLCFDVFYGYMIYHISVTSGKGLFCILFSFVLVSFCDFFELNSFLYFHFVYFDITLLLIRFRFCLSFFLGGCSEGTVEVLQRILRVSLESTKRNLRGYAENSRRVQGSFTNISQRVLRAFSKGAKSFLREYKELS